VETRSKRSEASASGQSPIRRFIRIWPTVLSISSQDGRDLLAVLRCAENPFHPSIQRDTLLPISPEARAEEGLQCGID
jgi:hypothetical protein